MVTSPSVKHSKNMFFTLAIAGLLAVSGILALSMRTPDTGGSAPALGALSSPLVGNAEMAACTTTSTLCGPGNQCKIAIINNVPTCVYPSNCAICK